MFPSLTRQIFQILSADTIYSSPSHLQALVVSQAMALDLGIPNGQSSHPTFSQKKPWTSTRKLFSTITCSQVIALADDSGDVG